MDVTAISELGLTRQREVVLRVIRTSNEHLTANEVFAKAKDLLPSISFATVYNSLRYLKESGHIAEVQFGNGASRFDRMTDRHDHALCTSCGKLVDIEMTLPEAFIGEASKLSRFKPESLEFTLRGKCPECAS
ncbi:MAG: transcriptional repressor [Acidobacteria bacterium]|nr:transcriptional repressor [Acidobacteriota bacterium]MCW5947995.1 transcriptional repressor [Pyrinomonadaceae bacterium]